MRATYNLSKIFKITAFAGTIFCFLLTNETKAQSDKDKSDLEQVKPLNNSFFEGEKQDMNGHLPEDKSTKKNSQKDPVIRDSSGYRVGEQKEVKEEGKSTLSFNIFLYVLDRFKEN
jgi:hypothetical protein